MKEIDTDKNEKYADSVDNISLKQLENTRKMVDIILQGISRGEISDDFAIYLLEGIRDQIINTYNQRIELLCTLMGVDPENMKNSRDNELSNLDFLMGKISTRNGHYTY